MKNMKFSKFFILILILSLVVIPGCKKVDSSNDIEYFITINLKDVFTNADLSGRVVLNGIDGQGGDRFTITSNTLSSVEVEVSGYKRSYILGTLGDDEIILARDKNGIFTTYNLTGNVAIYLYLVPDDFDTVKLAKSIGNWNDAYPSDTLGDGTVIRYDKKGKDIDVCIVNDDMTATDDTEKNLIDAIAMINDSVKNVNKNITPIIKLNYVGKLTDNLSNGVTHLIKNSNPLHGETFNDRTYIISKSGIITMPAASFNTILKELTQASTGLRADGGTMGILYVSAGKFTSDAGKAIYLVNFSPPGFQYSTNDGDPASGQMIEVISSVYQQREDEIMRRGFSPGSVGVPAHSGVSSEMKIDNQKSRDKKK